MESSFDQFKKRIAHLGRYVKNKIHTYLIFWKDLNPLSKSEGGQAKKSA
jgi:hypothetical protein